MSNSGHAAKPHAALHARGTAGHSSQVGTRESGLRHPESNVLAGSSSKFIGSHGLSNYERYHGSAATAPTTVGVPRRSSSGLRGVMVPAGPPPSMSARSGLSILDQMSSSRSTQSYTPSSAKATMASSAGTWNTYASTTPSQRSLASSALPPTSSDLSAGDHMRTRRSNRVYSTDDSPRHSMPRNHSFSSNASGSVESDLWSNSSPTYSSPRPGGPPSPSSICSDATSLPSQRSVSVPPRQGASRRVSYSSDCDSPLARSLTRAEREEQERQYAAAAERAQRERERERAHREAERYASLSGRAASGDHGRERQRDGVLLDRSGSLGRSVPSNEPPPRMHRVESAPRLTPPPAALTLPASVAPHSSAAVRVMDACNMDVRGVDAVCVLEPRSYHDARSMDGRHATGGYVDSGTAAAITPRAYEGALHLVGSGCGGSDGRAITRLIRSSSPGQGCVGLSNLGNTCFMNSILQCLNAVPDLVVEFQQPRLKWSEKAYVAPAYARLVAQIWSGSCMSVVSPSSFLAAVSRYDNRWGSGRQQDSQEFLHSLLEALQSECNRVTCKPKYVELQGKGSVQQQADEAEHYARSWHDSVIDDIFGGQLLSTIECQVCKRQSHCFDPFLDLCIPLPKRGGSVTSCMASFVETEKLDNSESYKCEGCKKFQPATKRLQIYRYPRVLVLTLKRFSASSTFARFSFTSKNSTAVSIDTNELDLTPFCNEQGLQRAKGSMPAPVYKLIGVSNHSGSLGGGHYTAQCRSVADGKWYDFNDSSVSKNSPPDSPSSSAYVLFYRLAHMDASL